MDPEACFYNYKATVTKPNNDYVIEHYDWAVSSNNDDASSPVPDGTNSVAITWKNRTNSSQKWIKVSVRIGRPGKQDTIITDQKSVVIKYIAPITQITISGANPSSPANNGTTTLPCGVQTVNVSVNSVATDPISTVTYTWQFPSTWTGSGSTSTPGRTATSDVGQSDGFILVRARRTDSDCNFEQSYYVTVNRPQVAPPVVITPSGAPTLCSTSQTVSLSASATDATTYSWTASGGAIIHSGQNSATAVIKATANGSVQVVANNACMVGQTASRSIYYGTPTIASNTVNGSPAQSINYITNPAYLVTISNFPGVSYSWSIVDGTGSIYPSGNTCTAYAYPFVRVRAQTQNTCGIGQSYTYYLYESGSAFHITSTNPMDDVLTIEFEDADMTNRYLESIELSSPSQRGIRKFDGRKAGKEGYFNHTKQVSFDVSNLRSGIYYLTVQLAGQQFARTLLKNK